MRYSTAARRSLLLLISVVLGAQLAQPAASAATAALPGALIWSSAAPQPGEVSLFRVIFTTTAPISAELRIFADTRYEAWLDGVWLGRGPARFSVVYQEYDWLPVAQLGNGAHTLAVLARYDPNTRRSEDLGGGVQAALVQQGSGATIVATGPAWRAVTSPAWNSAAAPISDLGLIGEQELLDYRYLPANWTSLAFDDGAWPAATTLGRQLVSVGARTIPQLRDTPEQRAVVQEQGRLAPGRTVVELAPPADGSGTVALQLNPPGSTTLDLEALTPLTLALNGQPVSAWQPAATPTRPDLLRLTQPLAAGPSTLTVAVPPGGTTLTIRATDLGWSAPALNQSSDPGRRMLLAEPRPDDTAPITVISTTAGLDIMLPDAQPRYLVLDWGRTRHGRLVGNIVGPSGAVVDIGWAERLWAGRAFPAPGSLQSVGWRQVDSWVLDGTSRPLTTLDSRAGRYTVLASWGGPVTLRGLRLLEETYPVNQRGSFESADPLLNQAWQVGVDSLRPNMTDAYTDTPWRERGQWWGDANIAFAINSVVYGDTALLRRGLRQVAATAHPDGLLAPIAPAHGDTSSLLDYHLGWIELLYRYWQLTDDQALVAELYPTMQRALAYPQRYANQSGLLDLPLDGGWWETALLDWTAWNSRTGISTALNAQYAAANRWGATLAGMLGDSAAASVYQARAQLLTDELNAQLYLDQRQGYTASRLPTRLRRPAPQAQAWALHYGAVPAARQASVGTALADQVEPFWVAGYAVAEISGLYWVLDGLGQTGQASAARTLIHHEYGRLLARGATTWWETFTSDQRIDSSLSHAWGGAPTWYLSSYLLGAQQQDRRTWVVAPQPAGLTWARGTIPFNQSNLAVSWQQPVCGSFALTLSAPAETTGTLRIPVPSGATVQLDGQPIQADESSGSRVHYRAGALEVLNLAGGAHSVSASYPCSTVYIPLVR